MKHAGIVRGARLDLALALSVLILGLAAPAALSLGAPSPSPSPDVDQLALDAGRAAPSGAMRVNGGAAATNKLTVTVNSAVTGAKTMQIVTRNGEEWVFADPRPYAAKATATLYGVDEAKTVVVYYASASGSKLRLSDSIVLDRVKPSGTTRLNGGAFATNKRIVTMNSDIVGATRMRMGTVAGGKWVWTPSATGWLKYAATRSLYLSVKDGPKMVVADYKDAAGNEFRVPYLKITLDATPPSMISIASVTHRYETVWYAASDVNVNWTPHKDDTGVTAYSYVMNKQNVTTPDKAADPTPLGTALRFTGLSDGKWVFHVRARDGAGNWGPTAKREVRIDTLPPVTRQSGADDAWHSRPVTVRFLASDAGSGVASTKYRLDGGTPTTGNRVIVPAPFTNSQVTHVLEYYSVDNKGLKEAVKSCTVRIDTIDRAAPSIKGLLPMPQYNKVKHGSIAELHFRVADPIPTCGKAAVTFAIRSGIKPYPVVQTIRVPGVLTNRTVTVRFRCNLSPANYGLYAQATDSVGHAGDVKQFYLKVTR